MSAATQYLVVTLLVYAGVSAIACWGLDLQFGQTGVLNLGFIMYVAIGAYLSGMLSLGPATATGYQHYLFGARLPFPLPWVCAALGAGALGGVVGLLSLRRLRGDYEAIVMLVVSLIALVIAGADSGLVGGTNGLSDIPMPFGSLGLSQLGSGYLYVALTAVATLVVGAFTWRLMRSPVGRLLRAVRENESTVAATGRSVAEVRILSYVLGAVFAGLAGAIQAQFIGAWAPNGWNYTETFTLFAAVIIGGRGNQWGVLLGATLVPVAVFQGVIFLPNLSATVNVAALQWIVAGVAVMAFMWFRPAGVLPERRQRLP